MIKKTKILASVIILAMVVVAVIWAFTSTNVQNQEPLKIGVIVYPGFAPFFIADEKDFFEKEDVNAEVVLINDPNQAISLLESNQVHLLFSSADFTAISQR